MGRDMIKMIFGYHAQSNGKTWVAMVFDVCIVGVPWFAWRAPRLVCCGIVQLFLMGGVFCSVLNVVLLGVHYVWWLLFFTIFGHHWLWFGHKCEVCVGHL
jgi:hypothetical protein